MSKLLNPKEIIRFNLEGQPAVTYLLRVPTLYDAVGLRRAIAARGGRLISVLGKLALLRAGIEEIIGEEGDQESKARLLALVDESKAWIETFYAKVRSNALDEEEMKESLAEQLELEAGLREVAIVVASQYQPYADALADEQVYPEIHAIECARLFLVGWEGTEVPFKRTMSGVPDEILMTIPRFHLIQIGNEVDRLMSPTKEEAKNSDSLSPTPSDTRTSSKANTQAQTAH